MANRREFLQGAAVVGVPMVVVMPDVGNAMPPAVAQFHAVLVDTRHPESVQFGARLAARGERMASLVDGDLTALWLSDIAPAWRKAPVPLAGLTRPSTLFCLEQFAWSQGLRVSFHAEHVVESVHATGHVVHRAAAELPALRGPLWPSTLADLVAAQGRRKPRVDTGPSLAGLSPTLPAGAELLTSWIIAPA